MTSHGSGTPLRALLLLAEPRDAKLWRLHASPGGPAPVGLLGWQVQPEPVDAGVPPEVSRLVAAALCDVGWVTFLHGAALGSGSAWEAFERGFRCSLRPGLRDRLRRRPTFPLVCTSDPELVAKAFDDERFVWDLRSQVLFLSPRDAGPPGLGYAHILRVLEASSADLSFVRREVGVQGLVLPGVGGDFIELVPFASELGGTLQQALARRCALEGVAWEVVPEPAFKARLASQENASST